LLSIQLTAIFPRETCDVSHINWCGPL